MNFTPFIRYSLSFLLLFNLGNANADPTANPLFQINTLRSAYQGAFTVSHTRPDDFEFTTAYAEGRIAYNPNNNSVFIDSHIYKNAVIEFGIPNFLSKNLDHLPQGDRLTDFVEILDNTVTGNNQNIDRLGAFALIENDLFVQTYEYYDANTDVTDTTLILRNTDNSLSTSADGFFQMQGGAETVSYISPIPQQWQAILKGKYLAGSGSGFPINTRSSFGPSLYSFDPDETNGKSSGTISTTQWQSYDLANALSTSLYPYATDNNGIWDGYNQTGQQSGFADGQSNNLWTEASSAWFGFIPTGTRTFVVLGQSGMNESGGAYKATQTDGNICGGPCSFDPNDNYSYYWLYDLNDIINAANPYEAIPYDYGIFDNSFGDGGINTGYPSGGSYDPKTGTLYLLMKSGTGVNGAADPIIAVYQLGSVKNNKLTLAPVVDLLIREDDSEVE